MRSKYILSSTGGPVIFSELLTHVDVACALFSRDSVVGAGFCYVNNDGLYVCYGESISLKIKSREALDSKELNKLLGHTND